MNFNIELDENNYIKSLYFSVHGQYTEKDIDISKMDMGYLDCYKYENKAVYLDNEKYVIEKTKRDHDNRISELKQYLKDTDYIIAETFEKVMSLNNAVTFIADFIKIMVEFKTKYSDILTARQQARAEIEDNTETK